MSMIVIRLRAFTLMAILLVVLGFIGVLVGDLVGGLVVLSDIGLLVGATGLALWIVGWLERRLASVEQAFVMGAKLVDADQSLTPIRR